MGGLSPWHIIILLLVVLLVFGAKRLPEIGRGLGTGMREFKRGVSGEHEPATPEAIAPTATPDAARSTSTEDQKVS